MLTPATRDWFDIGLPHAFGAMLPDGRVFGRCMTTRDDFHPLAHINVAGEDMIFWHTSERACEVSNFATSPTQSFGKGRLRRLSVAVMGCSGTESPVIEQLALLDIGKLVMIDDDRLEGRNINRILNATMADVRGKRLKVDVLDDAVCRTENRPRVVTLALNLESPEAVNAVAQCDLVFDCMDTIDVRFPLNTIAAGYRLPYIDLSVRIAAVLDRPKKGKILAVCSRSIADRYLLLTRLS